MKNAYQLLVLMIICCSCSHNSQIIIPKNCEELKAQGIIDSFPYPVRPGSAEWKNFKTAAEMYEALNVPENILQNMCTHGLVYTCVYCPLFWDLLVFNNIRSGFISLRDRINSFAELTNRDDAGKELFDYYKILFDTTLSGVKWIKSQAQIYITEIFFAQQEYLSKLNNQELQEVLTETYIRLQFKEKYKMDKYIISSSFYLIGNILYHNLQYEPLIDFIDRNNMSPFLNDLWLINNQSTDSIKYYTESYIKEFIPPLR